MDKEVPLEEKKKEKKKRVLHANLLKLKEIIYIKFMNSSVHLPEVIQWMRLLAGPLADLNFQGK